MHNARTSYVVRGPAKAYTLFLRVFHYCTDNKMVGQRSYKPEVTEKYSDVMIYLISKQNLPISNECKERVRNNTDERDNTNIASHFVVIECYVVGSAYQHDTSSSFRKEINYAETAACTLSTRFTTLLFGNSNMQLAQVNVP